MFLGLTDAIIDEENGVDDKQLGENGEAMNIGLCIIL